MRLNLDHLSSAQRAVVAAWLEDNGCRHYVAIAPVTIHGNYVEYTAVCRKDKASIRRMPIIDDRVPAIKKRLRIRVPRTVLLSRLRAA